MLANPSEAIHWNRSRKDPGTMLCEEKVPHLPNPISPETKARSVFARYRARVEAQRRTDAQKLDLITQLLREVISSVRHDVLADAYLEVASPCRPTGRLTPLSIVRATVQTFGNRSFRLDDLQRSVSDLYPGFEISRSVLSRRLFDLRTGAHPIIELVSETESGSAGNKARQRRYRYTGPPR